MNTCRVLLIALASIPSLANASGRLELTVVDRDTGQPIAARLELKNARGMPVRPRVKDAVVWNGQIVFDGKLMLNLANGGYTFTLERGPEYRVIHGHFNIENFADDAKQVELSRFCNLAKEGWFSGDLDVERPENQIELLMQADDVHVVPLVTWSNVKPRSSTLPPLKEAVVRFDFNRFFSPYGGQLETPGNTLRLFGLDEVLNFPKPPALPRRSAAAIDRPALDEALGSLPWLPLAAEAKQKHPGLWLDAGAPFARDLPIWIAAGLVDSVQLANRHLLRGGVVAHEAGGWPRDKALFPDPHGIGRWSQEIYYHMLEAGLRIPPTAGSGSGENSNPLGYNRLYVHVGAEPAAGAGGAFDWSDWWTALRAGRVMITNGPLLRPHVEGRLPGHTFHGQEGRPLELLVALTLSTRDKIRYLELIKNGRIAAEVNLQQYQAAGGKLPPLVFDDSGWFLVRAVADQGGTYRYAATAPYFVEFKDRSRVSRKSAQFFLDWTARRGAEIAAAAGASPPPQAQAALSRIDEAKAYWTNKLDSATAD